jgi:hypothetical protein
MERIKDPFGIFRWQSNARIADRDDYLTLRVRSRRNRQFASGILHSLDRVQHQVHENLLNLHAVNQDFRRFCVDCGMNRYRVAIRLDSEQSGHFKNNRPNVDYLTFRGHAFFVEGPQTVDDIGRTVSLLLASSRCGSRPFEVWGIMREPSQTSVGACDRGGDGLLDFVR